MLKTILYKKLHESVYIMLFSLPYLPVYNTHPYFGLHFQKKKKEAKNSGSGYEKIV